MPTSLLRAGALAADYSTAVNRPTFAVRNGHRVANFPNSVTTETFFTFNMPTVYANGDIKVQLIWMAETAIAGDVLWAVAFERHQENTEDLDSDNFAADVTLADTAPGTSGQVSEAIITLTNAEADSVSQGEQFRLRVRRLGGDGSDTMAGVAQLMTVVLEQDADPVGGGGGGFFSDGAGTRAGIGQGSPAPTAAGSESLSHGSGANALGDDSLAFFAYAYAKGKSSIAIGRDTVASISNGYGVAIGHGAQAQAYCQAVGGFAYADQWGSAAAFGDYARAKGEKSVAIGSYSYTHPNSLRGIAIGRDAEARQQDSISIGYNIYNDHQAGIVIGRNNTLDASGAGGTVIGTGNIINTGFWRYGSIVMGQNNRIDSNHTNPSVFITYSGGYPSGRMANDAGVLIGGEGFGQGAGQTGYPYANIIIRASDDSETGMYFRSTNPGACIAIATSRACLHSGNGAYEQGHYGTIFLGSGSSYAFGATYDSFIVLTDGASVGDNGVYTWSKNNTFIIHQGFGEAEFTNEGENANYGNVTIGKDIYGAMYEYCKGNIALGSDGYIWNVGYGNASYGQILLGLNNFIRGSGYGNIAMGYGARIYNTSGSATYSRGNVALGNYVYCQVMTGSGYVNSAMAQGINSHSWINGQRSFGAGGPEDIGGNTKPNQKSFTVEKHETTDATTTTIITYPTQADKAYSLVGWAVARRTDADGSNAVFSMAHTLCYRNAAGAPVLNGDPVSWTMDDNQGAPAWTITCTISGNNILVRITGTAAQTVEWLVDFYVREVRG